MTLSTLLATLDELTTSNRIWWDIHIASWHISAELHYDGGRDYPLTPGDYEETVFNDEAEDLEGLIALALTRVLTAAGYPFPEGVAVLPEGGVNASQTDHPH